MEKITIDPFTCFNNDWALVTAGDKDDFNTMTISWGSMGTIWSMPTVTVYVKPIRYTHDYMEKSDIFTVSFFDEKYKRDLSILGSKSKRDCDKLSLTGLNPTFLDNGITFEEAKLTLVLEKIYSQDFSTDTMLKKVIDNYYKTEEPHTMYVGKVIDIIKGDK